MKPIYAIIVSVVAVGCFASCGTSATKDNDPWGKIDPGEATKQSAVIEGSLQSSNMNRTMTYSVWIPADYDKSKTYPFLYLLHGMEFGDDSRLDRCWLDKGNAAKIADDYQKGGGVPMVIIMPNGLNASMYSGNYEPYFHEELMPKVEEEFKCNGQRAIAGLSMGGYGTLYHSLKYPRKFLYAYAMSPAVDNSWPSTLVDKQSDKSVFPPFTIEIGLRDGTVNNDQSKSLYNSLTQKGLTGEWVERDGTHDWPFWQGCLPKALIQVGKSFK